MRINLFKASASIGLFTILSRIAGFIRDVLILKYVGAGAVYDAFIVAFKLPNFFRRITAEGAFHPSFVPLFSTILAENGREEALKFARQVLTLMAAILTVFSFIVVIAAPYVVKGIAFGFEETPERFAWAVGFTRITFFYILFISLTALMSGVLNSFGSFGPAAAAPVLLNLTMIGGLLGLTPFVANEGYALSWGVFAGGVAQLLMLWGWLKWKMNVSLLPAKIDQPERLKLLLKKMAPGIIGASVYQINLFVDTTIGSQLPVGSLSYIFTADRLNQLPLSVIGIAISTAILAPLSQAFQREEVAAARSQFSQAIAYALLLTLPAACALFILSFPIIKILFERGAFTPIDTAATAQTLQAIVIGLPAYVLLKVLAVGFFARLDTKTPVRIAGVCVGFNIIFCILLSHYYSYVGIGLAISLSCWINVILLTVFLHRSNFPVVSFPLMKTIGKICIASLIMSGVLYGLFIFSGALFLQPNGLTSWLGLGGIIFIGISVYGGCVVVLKLVNLRTLLEKLR